MTVLVIGMFLVICGALSMGFPELVESIKKNDRQQWEVLGSPPAYAFSKTIGVFSWVLGRGYEHCTNEEIVSLGRKVRPKALFAKYSMLVGVCMIAVGFVYTLATL